ncbi:MAG: hypothetical protein EOO08_15465 [Chitinophagaceae bacterium]|nr:MAG: hypothetical protein EOO08_15465 [Chitinophagaceae bacterium]
MKEPLQNTKPAPNNRGSKVAEASDPSEIDFETLWRIAHRHQSNPGGKDPESPTQFAHFPLRAIAKFLIDNTALEPSTSLGSLIDPEKTPAYGIKAYFIQHLTKADCPNGDEKFIGCNSIALVLTYSYDKGANWHDIMSPAKSNTAQVAFLAGENAPDLKDFPGIAGDALDRTELYPPGGTSIYHSPLDPTKEPPVAP